MENFEHVQYNTTLLPGNICFAQGKCHGDKYAHAYMFAVPVEALTDCFSVSNICGVF